MSSTPWQRAATSRSSQAPRRWRWPLAVVAAALALVPAAVGFAAPASAAGDESVVTWAVSPATESASDGRRWIESELEPGSTVQEHLAVRNFGESEITFGLSAADGYFTAAGRFNMLASEQESVASGTWITVQPTITVAPGGTAIVPFTIQVPTDASPGDHAAGISASIYSEGTGDGAKLGVESRVGFRVMTRVSGTIQPDATADIAASYVTSWNPFEPGTIELEYALENTGNVQLSVDGHASFAGERMPNADSENARPVELLPGERRVVAIDLPDAWPLGPVVVPVTIEPSAITPGGDAQPMKPIVREVTVWAIPWPHISIVGALILMSAGLLWGRRRRAKQVDRLIADAREAGRREAQQA